jgi:hypothetical protein
MFARKIGIDESQRARRVRRCFRLAPPLPGGWRLVAQELPDGRRIKLVLAAEVPIKAAVGEASSIDTPA